MVTARDIQFSLIEEQDVAIDVQQTVQITDIKVPFRSVFVLLVKIWLAALLLGIVSWIMWAILMKTLTTPFIH